MSAISPRPRPRPPLQHNQRRNYPKFSAVSTLMYFYTRIGLWPSQDGHRRTFASRHSRAILQTTWLNCDINNLTDLRLRTLPQLAIKSGQPHLPDLYTPSYVVSGSSCEMSNRLPNIQKALLIPKRFGTPVVDTIPIPKPAEGQVLVKVHSVGLNPADAKIWKHDLGQATYPLVLGLDIAGEIVEIGNGVKGFSKGDRV